MDLDRFRDRRVIIAAAVGALALAAAFGAGLGGGVDELERALQLTVMVARQLGDDERRVLGPDRAAGDFKRRGQDFLPPQSTRNMADTR